MEILRNWNVEDENVADYWRIFCVVAFLTVSSFDGS